MSISVGQPPPFLAGIGVATQKVYHILLISTIVDLNSFLFHPLHTACNNKLKVMTTQIINLIKF